MTGCPRCHSTELETLEAPGEWLDVLQCRACGHRWAVN